MYIYDCSRWLRWREERREDLRMMFQCLQCAALQTEWCSTWSNRRKGSLRRRGTERGSSSSSRAGWPLKASRSTRGGKCSKTSIVEGGALSWSRWCCCPVTQTQSTNQQIDSSWLEVSLVKFYRTECRTFNFHSVPALMFQHPNDVNSCDTSTKGSVVNISFQTAEKKIISLNCSSECSSECSSDNTLLHFSPLQTFLSFLVSKRPVWPVSLQVQPDQTTGAGGRDSRLPGSGRPLWWWSR